MKNFGRYLLVVALLILFVGGSVWGAKTWKAMNIEDCTLVGTTTNSGTISGGAVSVNAVSGTTGTFTGAVSGTSGTFSAGVSGTTGTFSSTVSGVAGTFSGAVSGTTGTFSDAVSGTTITGTATEFGIGTISSTEIANITRDIYLPMAGWVASASNDIDDASEPTIGVVDSVPAIVWANSAATGGILQTLRTPSDYASNFIIYCLISSDTNNETGASNAIDWEIWDNYNGAGFDAAAVAQSTVVSQNTSLSTSCEVLTLTPDATAEAMILPGHFYTIKLFNATTHASANLELKGVHVVYTAIQ